LREPIAAYAWEADVREETLHLVDHGDCPWKHIACVEARGFVQVREDEAAVFQTVERSLVHWTCGREGRFRGVAQVHWR
jgi:hypothetical protein